MAHGASTKAGVYSESFSGNAVLLWSGGKDAAMALQAEWAAGDVDVVALLTTVVTPRETVTAHEVPLHLIHAQADALGLPLAVMRIPPGASNEVYEGRMREALAPYREQGVSCVVAGDLYLEDIRAYREQLFEQMQMRVRFPLWEADTSRLARRFLYDGFRAVVASVDTTLLDRSFAGRPYDEAFLADLPDHIDPCGEEGAFHTFAHDGPLFDRPIHVRVGETCCRERMCHATLSPGAGLASDG